MALQKPAPSAPSTSAFAMRRSPSPRARARPVSHLGVSRRRTDGRFRGPSSLRIQHLDQLASGLLARQPEEDVFERAVAPPLATAQLVHGAAGADGPALDDADAVAH